MLMESTAKIDVTLPLEQVKQKLGLHLTKRQSRGVEVAMERNLSIITGGPGTGKTTSIRAILALFDALKLDTQLAAPTGRAAKRMSELTGQSAQTIHRLLEAGMSDDHQDITFRRDEDDPLECDAVILDECSMVDISLMCALLRAMRPDVLAFDEISAPEDIEAMRIAAGCGVALLATAHAQSVGALRCRTLYRALLDEHIFRRAVCITRSGGARFYTLEELP